MVNLRLLTQLLVSHHYAIILVSPACSFLSLLSLLSASSSALRLTLSAEARPQWKRAEDEAVEVEEDGRRSRELKIKKNRDDYKGKPRRYFIAYLLGCTLAYVVFFSLHVDLEKKEGKMRKNVPKTEVKGNQRKSFRIRSFKRNFFCPFAKDSGKTSSSFGLFSFRRSRICFLGFGENRRLRAIGMRTGM